MPNLGWRENERACRKFLRCIGPWNWGFVIYRTVYTPESDRLWPLVLARLDAYIYKSIWYDFDNQEPDASTGEIPLDPEPNRQVSAQLKNLILSDKEQFDGLSINDVGDHFVSFFDDNQVPDIPRINQSSCLLIDQDVFEALRDAPIPLPKVEDPDVWIKVVDGDFDPDDLSEYAPGFGGWALSKLQLLWTLYWCVDGSEMLSAGVVCSPQSFDGQVFRWAG